MTRYKHRQTSLAISLLLACALLIVPVRAFAAELELVEEPQALEAVEEAVAEQAEPAVPAEEPAPEPEPLDEAVPEEEVAPEAAGAVTLTEENITVEVADIVFTGEQQKPAVTVTYKAPNGKTTKLVMNKDFTVRYYGLFDNRTATYVSPSVMPQASVRNAGVCYVYSVQGIGNYSGYVHYGMGASGNIAPAYWSEVSVTVPDQAWTGKSIVPEYTVKLGNVVLEEGIDYQIYPTGSNTNVNVGDGRLTLFNANMPAVDYIPNVFGGGDQNSPYYSYKYVPFKIIGDLKDAKIASVADQRYVGKAVTPKVTLTHPGKAGNDKTLVEGTDYKLSYKNNTAAGTATITITGMGYYKGTRTATFKIVSPWQRLGGKNALATMGKIVGEGFSKSTEAVIATSGTFKDALAAAPLAGSKGAPILLTSKDALSAQTKAEISRLGVKNVTIVGGPLAVSEAVESQLRALGCNVSRVSGSSATATSRAVARKVGNTMGTVIIATSADFADALSIAPWAYAKKAPILLTNNEGLLPQSSANLVGSLGFRRAVIVGGASAVDSSVDVQLKKLGVSVIRLAGRSATDTSKEVALWELKEGFSLANVAVATRTSYKDALTGSALMGRLKGPVILVNGESYTAVNAVIKGKVAQIEQGYFFGGTAVVSKDVAAKIQEIK